MFLGEGHESEECFYIGECNSLLYRDALQKTSHSYEHEKYQKLPSVILSYVYTACVFDPVKNPTHTSYQKQNKEAIFVKKTIPCPLIGFLGKLDISWGLVLWIFQHSRCYHMG
jgi:hypothetical protein